MHQASQTRLVVDRTHLGHRASGIERITRDLFSSEALSPLAVEGLDASGRASIVFKQRIYAPAAAMLRRDTIWAFSGHPPSPLFRHLRERTVFYVHDLFLMTRRADLNRSAKLYMAAPFKVAVENLRYFLVNSETTGRQLRQFVRGDAEILPYRPLIGNVFGLSPRPLATNRPDGPLIVGAIGTIEPRKNFLAAARVCQALAARLNRDVELHIIGRRGWGEDADRLAGMKHVHLYGFLPDEAVRGLIERFDFLICTSHDEGLGLPLLEVQHAGIPVVAPDQEVFREVLGSSGTFIDPSDPKGAAATIEGLLGRSDWREQCRASAIGNVERWNAQADADRTSIIAFLSRLSERLTGGRA